MPAIRTSQHFTPSVRIDHLPQRRGNLGGRRRLSPPVPPAIDRIVHESADLYFQRRSKGLDYRHFDGAVLALRFMRDNLSPVQVSGAVLEVGDDRFDGKLLATMVKGLAPRPENS